jgi:hypothetical protein
MPFSAKKIAFFLKNQCCDQIFAEACAKSANLIAEFFAEQS